MEQLDVPQGRFILARHPQRPKETFRAWDAADEYALRHLAAEDVDLSGPVVILNDTFGALSVALAEHQPLAGGEGGLPSISGAINA